MCSGEKIKINEKRSFYFHFLQLVSIESRLPISSFRCCFDGFVMKITLISVLFMPKKRGEGDIEA